jgi:hypothetical protein
MESIILVVSVSLPASTTSSGFSYMPFEFTVTEDPVGITTRFYGVVSDEDLIQSCYDRTQSSSLVSQLSYLLDDFSEVSEFVVTKEGVIKTAEFAVQLSHQNSAVVYLSVVPTDLLYGMSRMWQAFTDETHWERQIFRSEEEARAWISDNLSQPASI